ncbi:hypothetical protein, partial [Bifidobacterium commune]|uniref:hypothetical protein n=1 Tax=Bifidobacterium commune TaxID=1505727 RepID=UPI0022773291
ISIHAPAKGATANLKSNIPKCKQRYCTSCESLQNSRKSVIFSSLFNYQTAIRPIIKNDSPKIPCKTGANLLKKNECFTFALATTTLHTLLQYKQ